jgi:hypothetical protein
MSSPTNDAAISRLLDAIGSGVTARDATGNLLLRLCNRVGALEKLTAQQGKTIDRLAKEPRVPWSVPPAEKPMTGIDAASGAPVKIEPRRAVGRPPGRRDSRPRRTTGRKLVGSMLYHREDLEGFGE